MTVEQENETMAEECKHGFRPAADCIICERDALRHENNSLREQLVEMARRRDRWKTIAETPRHEWRKRAQVAESKADSYAKRLVDLEERIGALCSLLGAHFPDQAHDIGFLEFRVRRLHERQLAEATSRATVT